MTVKKCVARSLVLSRYPTCVYLSLARLEALAVHDYREHCTSSPSKQRCMEPPHHQFPRLTHTRDTPTLALQDARPLYEKHYSLLRYTSPIPRVTRPLKHAPSIQQAIRNLSANEWITTDAIAKRNSQRTRNLITSYSLTWHSSGLDGTIYTWPIPPFPPFLSRALASLR